MHYHQQRVHSRSISRVRTRYKDCPKSQGEHIRRSGLLAEQLRAVWEFLRAHAHLKRAHTHLKRTHTHLKCAHTHLKRAHTHLKRAHTHIWSVRTHTSEAYVHISEAHAHTHSRVNSARILNWALLRFFEHGWINSDKTTSKCMFWLISL